MNIGFNKELQEITDLLTHKLRRRDDFILARLERIAWLADRSAEAWANFCWSRYERNKWGRGAR